ncbi:MAG: DedA family protein [Fimbriimonas ginsengisoli]|uniref:DedA family protein n=1 Tax=Fimbriimonas ginsengisoli TaxID=1005039 RepID=A0A931LS09_FIMGI|nr:DedA family protein [Fimbriimonas ginsengisoli]
MDGLVDAIKTWAEHIVLTLGYPGLVMLAALGNANIPIPSEAVLPFAGILAGQGKLNLHAIAWWSTLGSVLGSAISYGFGAFLGRDFLMRYGKFVLMRPAEIEHAERWFERYGLPFTLWGRAVPLLRTFVSLPAGMYRSRFDVFLLYAFLGSLPWCYLWAYLGQALGRHWDAVERNMRWVDVAVVLVVVGLFARWIARRRRLNHVADSPDRLE